MFWKRVRKGIGPSRGGLNNIMKKLHQTYKECGGDKWKNDEDEVEGLNPFDALKIIICKKLNHTRGAIRDLDEIPSGSTRAKVGKKNDIRRMLALIELDFNKMKDIQHRSANPRKFFRRKIDYKLVESQREDVVLIEKHIEEVESIYKKRFKMEDKTGGGMKSKKKLDSLVGDSDSEDEKDDTEDLSEIALENPHNSHLPAIDITQAMLQVKENRNELKQGLDIFNSKLDDIYEQAVDIGYQIGESTKVMEDINIKVEKNTDAINNLTKKTEKANKKISGQTKLLLIIILMILIIVGIIVVYIVLVSTGILVNPVRGFL